MLFSFQPSTSFEYPSYTKAGAVNLERLWHRLTIEIILGKEVMTMAAGMVLLLFIGFWLTMLASVWTVMEKAGRPGWYALIPGWNIYHFVKIAGMPGASMLLLFIPIVNLFYAVGLNMRLAKSFGQSQGFGFGMALFGILFWPLLAFGDSEYQGHDHEPPFNDRNRGRTFDDRNQSSSYQNEDGDWVEEVPLSDW